MVPPIKVTVEPSSVLHSLLPHARTPKVVEVEVDVDVDVEPEAVFDVDVDVLGQAGVALGSGLFVPDHVVPVQANHWQLAFSW
jgi:hypothetical protein